MSGRAIEAKTIERGVMARLFVANTIAGGVITTYFALSADVPPGSTLAQEVTFIAGGFLIGNVVLSLAALPRALRMVRPAVGWLDENRTPTADEAHAILRLPRRIAGFPLPYWLVVALTTSIAQAFATDPKPLFTLFGTLEGGLVACAIGFLLCERMLRPLLAVALPAVDPPEAPPVGVGFRLLVAWLLGSGIPLLGIVLTPFVVRDSDLPVTASMVFLAAAAFASGFLLTGAAARSIGEPMLGLRRALERVATGDLAASVAVDNAGEIGQLQRGFNEMVAGLRDRDRLADLFGRHVGSEVAQRAFDVGAELGGETREVSALFVDIIGSTAMARERPAEDVVSLLNEFFTTVVACVGEHGGWVNKFEGDGALCVFGAPLDQPDHAAQALRAARALARALDTVDAGIGVSSGTVVAGNVGAEQRLEYTVIGTPVNEAARLSEAAKHRPCRVLASHAAVDAAGAESHEWDEAGHLSLRGLPADFAVYEPRS